MDGGRDAAALMETQPKVKKVDVSGTHMVTEYAEDYRMEEAGKDVEAGAEKLLKKPGQHGVEEYSEDYRLEAAGKDIHDGAAKVAEKTGKHDVEEYSEDYRLKAAGEDIVKAAAAEGKHSVEEYSEDYRLEAAGEDVSEALTEAELEAKRRLKLLAKDVSAGVAQAATKGAKHDIEEYSEDYRMQEAGKDLEDAVKAGGGHSIEEYSEDYRMAEAGKDIVAGAEKLEKSAEHIAKEAEARVHDIHVKPQPEGADQYHKIMD